jgi:hypothetical protein
MTATTSILAKLLAKEDITIIHEGGITAAHFDLNKRILSLPVYKEMEGDIFDGMMASEVAHALWTPPVKFLSIKSKLEGMHEGYGQIIQMVEQARTAKFLKIEYPGLVSTLSRMYLEFWDRDYFGLRGKDLGNINLVDKLNISAKLPWIDIPMSPIETTFKNDLNKVESFKDACVLARDIIEYLQEEQRKKDEEQRKKDEEQQNESKPNDEPEESTDDCDDDDAGQPSDDGDDSETDELDEADDSSGDTSDEDESEDDEAEDESCGSDNSEDGLEDEHSDDDDVSENSGTDGSEIDDEQDEDSPDHQKSNEIGSDQDDDDDDADYSDEDADQDGDDAEDANDATDESGSDDDTEDGSEDGSGDDGSGSNAGDSDSSDEVSDTLDGSLIENGGNESSNQDQPNVIQSISNFANAIADNEVDLDAKDIKNLAVRNLLNPKDFVDPAKVVHTSWNASIIRDEPRTIKTINNQWIKFQKNEAKTIEIMKQMFDLRKNAAESRRVRTAKTGRLDLKKLAFYSISEDIFKSCSMVEDGKNHGIALLLDFSGSMSGSRMYQTWRQTLIMIMFCQSVNIPYVVYGFTNQSVYNYRSVKNIEIPLKIGKYKNDSSLTSLSVDRVVLREIINSDLPMLTQRQIMRNLYREAMSHNSGARYGITPCERFEGTPTNEALVIASQVIKEWKEAHSVEIMSTMLLTDGMAGDAKIGLDYRGRDNFIIHDELTRKKYSSYDYIVKPNDTSRIVLSRIITDLYRDRVDSSIITLYIGASAFLNMMIEMLLPRSEIDTHLGLLKKQNCTTATGVIGNDSIIFSLDRDVECELSLDSSKSMNSIATQFIEQSKKMLQIKVLADTLLTTISKKMTNDGI